MWYGYWVLWQGLLVNVVWVLVLILEDTGLSGMGIGFCARGYW